MRFFEKNIFDKNMSRRLESSAGHEKSLTHEKSDLKLTQYKRV